MAVKRLTDVLLGSIVTLVTAPLGVGTVVGGWLGGRHAETLTGGALSGALVGIVGALPWAWVVYLASAGHIEPIGYHERLVHIGITTASADALVLWQELALAGTVGAVLVCAATAGGVVAGMNVDVGSTVRAKLTRS